MPAETIYERVYRGLVVDIDQSARNSGKTVNVLRTPDLPTSTPAWGDS